MGGVRIVRRGAGGMSSADVAAMVSGATAALQARLTQAEQAVSNAQTAAQAAQSTAATAKSTADAAQSTIATTLVPGYTSLTDTANTVQGLNAASVADRAQLNARVSAHDARLAALEAKTWAVQKVSVSTSAALAIGASVDLTVTWTTPQPDLNYLVSVMPDANGVMLSSMVAVKSLSTTGAVITVKALVALTAGVKINVHAGRWG